MFGFVTWAHIKALSSDPGPTLRRQSRCPSLVFESLALKRPFEILQRDQHRHGINRRLDEAVMKVKALAVVGDGMQQKGAYAGDLGNLG